MFDTYGPYTLNSPEWNDVDDFYKELRRDETPNVENGIGIYIVFTENESGEVTPWYVGQTQRKFGSRLFEHFKNRKFVSLFKRGRVRLILIARAREGKIQQPKAGADKRYIDWLEVELIGHCLRLNSKLLNKRSAAFFRDLHVPGYKDKGGSERDFPAAQALSKLLKS